MACPHVNEEDIEHFVENAFSINRQNLLRIQSLGIYS